MKKPIKLLTNEHLLVKKMNNFALAEAAILVAYKNVEMGRGFSLQGTLNEVAKNISSEEVIETVVDI
jgi:hypothetical protein